MPEKNEHPDRVTLTLIPQPGVDSAQALRGALKVLLRRFGLRCVRIDAPENQATGGQDR